VQKNEDNLMRHIMVAIDGSSGADRAVDVAAEIAKALSGDLLIVTVADSQAFEEAQQLVRTEGSVGDVLEALTTQTLKAAEARARHLGVSQIELRVGWGDVTRSLIDIAKDGPVDMIVVGRRGRGQLAGLLLGSVSQKLVSLAPCAVVVAP
jgi:nucleotide-binding universal stress UspA family protein